MILAVIESFVLNLILLMVCVINIQNGPVGGVHYYEPEVRKRAVELGLITKEQIRKNMKYSMLALIGSLVILGPLMVFGVNGARTFGEGFAQLAVMYLLSGMFDRVFIDWHWVGHTKAWVIPGTEDLMPYIHRKTWVQKIVHTIILYPAAAALLAWICTTLFMRG